MRRASKILVNSSKLQTERDKVAADKQDRILSILEDLQETVLRLASKVDMNKKINMDKFFPIKDDASLEKFLDKTEGDFPEKRDAFENMLYLNVTKNLKLKRPFEASLLAVLFSRDFISSHRWPGPRYKEHIHKKI